MAVIMDMRSNMTELEAKHMLDIQLLPKWFDDYADFCVRFDVSPDGRIGFFARGRFITAVDLFYGVRRHFQAFDPIESQMIQEFIATSQTTGIVVVQTPAMKNKICPGYASDNTVYSVSLKGKVVKIGKRICTLNNVSFPSLYKLNSKHWAIIYTAGLDDDFIPSIIVNIYEIGTNELIRQVRSEYDGHENMIQAATLRDNGHLHLFYERNYVVLDINAPKGKRYVSGEFFQEYFDEVREFVAYSYTSHGASALRTTRKKGPLELYSFCELDDHFRLDRIKNINVLEQYIVFAAQHENDITIVMENRGHVEGGCRNGFSVYRVHLPVYIPKLSQLAFFEMLGKGVDKTALPEDSPFRPLPDYVEKPKRKRKRDEHSYFDTLLGSLF